MYFVFFPAAHHLTPASPVYWFLMRIGMIAGFFTAWPANAWLIRAGIKEAMGMVTFALFSLFFSIESKDERDSAFSLGTFSGKTFAVTTGVSFLLLLLSAVPGIFQTVMDTTRLDVPQWLICTTVALSIVAAAEIRKAARRRPGAM